MRCVVQRVSSASVIVDGEVVGAIDRGLLVLVGIADGDDDATLQWMADKIVRLRLFPDTTAGDLSSSNFDRSLLDVGGSVLSVSQFTLLGDTRKGTRPSFTKAARPGHALPAWERFNALVRAHGITVSTGTFGAHMDVSLVNDGPVTLTLDR